VAHLLPVFPLLHQGHPIDGASTANVTRVLARHTAPADARVMMCAMRDMPAVRLRCA
jgi:hypothetical protein